MNVEMDFRGQSWYQIEVQSSLMELHDSFEVRRIVFNVGVIHVILSLEQEKRF